MGGKGGGGGNYYNPPPDTSGYGTPEEAKKTLAKEAPIDYSKYQQAINVKKAAAAATAPPPGPATSLPADPTDTSETTGDVAAKSMLKPPDFWAQMGLTTTPPLPWPAKDVDPTLTSTQL